MLPHLFPETRGFALSRNQFLVASHLPVVKKVTGIEITYLTRNFPASAMSGSVCAVVPVNAD
jgi:hypothetical protein